jgi:polyhydroxybutyrate depolymerase
LAFGLSGCTFSTLEMVAHDGETRTYWLNTPESAPANAPLVLVLHGGNGTGQKIERQTGFSWVAEAEGFVVAYPNGIDKQWNDGRLDGPAGDQDDVGFLAAVIDDIATKHGIDPKRVFVTGASNGGMMSLRAGCELSDKVAAIAPVIASMPADLVDLCMPTDAVSVVFVAGTEDPLMPYGGGQVGPGDRGTIIPVEDSVALWVELNGCPPDPEVMEFPDMFPNDGTLLESEVYSQCDNGTEVIFYRIIGGGHTWPGGAAGRLIKNALGNVSKEMMASQAIWEFFKQHPKQ